MLIEKISSTDKSHSRRGQLVYQYTDKGIYIRLQDKDGNNRAEIFFREDEIYQREVVKWGWQSK